MKGYIMWFSSKKNKAFTLVELLVVISIIALLLSILMPSLNRARMQARGVVCGNNLKQMYYCLSLYIEDNEGFMPPNASRTTPPTQRNAEQCWAYLMQPYWGKEKMSLTMSNSMPRCPEEKAPHWSENYWYETDYGLNWRLRDYQTGNPVKLLSIKNPGQKIAYVDTYKSINFADAYWCYIKYRHPNNTAFYSFMDGHVMSHKDGEISPRAEYYPPTVHHDPDTALYYKYFYWDK